MKKVLLGLIAAVFYLSTVSAQDYNWAIGARLGGETSGLSVKYNLDGVNALEGVLSIPYRGGFNVLGMYERNIPVIAPGFNFYYGGGAHLGSWKRDHKSEFVLGVDGIVGLEYKISEVPLAISLDYKPALNIISHTRFYLGDVALGIKVTF